MKPIETNIYGISFCKRKLGRSYALANQFANIFLFPGLRETTIGEFLKNNPLLLKQAFSCEDFLYEPELKWIEGNLYPDEKSINPDFMLQRFDGYFDFCELKTGLFEKKKITRGKHRRRAFIKEVEDGLSQLANYEEYFQFNKNRLFASSQYNIKVSNPRLFLIIRNYENASLQEIREASRKHKSNITIIDYDTLNTLFLQSFTSKVS